MNALLFLSKHVHSLNGASRCCSDVDTVTGLCIMAGELEIVHFGLAAASVLLAGDTFPAAPRSFSHF